MTESAHLTLHEVSDELGVHYMTAYRYVRTGRLDAHKVGSGWQVSTAALERFREEGATSEPSGTVTPTEVVQGRLISRLIVADESGAWKLLEDALTSGHDPQSLYLDVLAPSMREIGERWAAGELTVADEHLASATVTRLLARLSPRMTRRGRKRGTVVIGAPAGDQHHLPSQFLADLVRGAGFQALSLGANSPSDSFSQAALAHDDCVAIVVSCSAPGAPLVLPELLSDLREAVPQIPVICGGSGLTAEQVPQGDAAWAADALGLLDWLDERTASRARSTAS